MIGSQTRDKQEDYALFHFKVNEEQGGFAILLLHAVFRIRIRVVPFYLRLLDPFQ